MRINGKEAIGDFRVSSPKLWNPNTPFLYGFSAVISTDDGVEKAEGKFGFRSISTNGKNVCLNGVPIFIRGYIRGATAHEHSNDAHLSEGSFIVKTLPKQRNSGLIR